MDPKKNVLLLGTDGGSRALAERLKNSSRVENVFLHGLQALSLNGGFDLIVTSLDDAHHAFIVTEFLRCGNTVLGSTQDITWFDKSQLFSLEVLGALNVPMVNTVTCYSRRRALTTAREMFATSSLPPHLASEDHAITAPQESLLQVRESIENYFARFPTRPLLLTCNEAGSETVTLHALCAGVDIASQSKEKKEFVMKRGEAASAHYILLGPHEIPKSTSDVAALFIPPFLRYWGEENERGFRGMLSVEVLITPSGPKLLKYHIGLNHRQKDAILSAGTGDYDFYDLCLACANGSLRTLIGKNQLGGSSSSLRREGSSAAA